MIRSTTGMFDVFAIQEGLEILGEITGTIV